MALFRTSRALGGARSQRSIYGNVGVRTFKLDSRKGLQPSNCPFVLEPTLLGMASTTAKIGPTTREPTLTGENIFNIYQAIGTGETFANSPRLEGSLSFETIPCVNELQIRIIGRADTYGAGFDTLIVDVDGVQKSFFASISRDQFSYSLPLPNTISYDSLITLTFDDNKPHTVTISGQSGSVANNNVGYDVQITFGVAPEPSPAIHIPIGNNNTGFVTHYIGDYPNGYAENALLFPSGYTQYWDTVTCNNPMKWQPNQDTAFQANSGTFRFNTKGAADYVYNYSLDNDLDFYWQTLLWGASQGYPAWLDGLSEASTKEVFDNWCSNIASKYTKIKGINVLNEPYPGHVAGTSMLSTQFGGAGATGYDWIIYLFERAKHYFPNSLRYLNEFDTLSNSTTRQYIIDVAKVLKERDLISGIGIQGHYFTTDTMTRDQITTALDDYRDQVNLPLYITELDISGQTKTGSSYNTGPGNFSEDLQLLRYQEVYPALYDHLSVDRITLWGYITTETWRYSRAGIDTGLINRDGTGKRKALTWLEDNYLNKL